MNESVQKKWEQTGGQADMLDMQIYLTEVIAFYLVFYQLFHLVFYL